MADLRKLLQRGFDRIRSLGRQDEAKPREPTEQSMKQLLEEYAEAIAASDNPTKHGVWIFERGVDHEVFLQAAMALLDDVRMEGRREGAKSVNEFEGHDCACRCREHGRVACPKCVEVERCPVHGDDDPSRISPRWREQQRK